MQNTPEADFAFDHAPGLPEPLPKGEEILWQGKPNAWRLAVESLSLKWILGYFALLAMWRVGSALADYSAAVALASLVPIAVLAAAATGILYAFSFAQARATIYTVTTARVILKIGVALPLTLQMPFRRIENIALDLRKTGHGTIAFEPQKDGGETLSYYFLWPHLRPWHMRLPQPAFRCIPNAAQVAEILAETAESQMAQPILAPRPAAEPEAATAARRPVSSGPAAAAPLPAE
ncbi:MAG: photosynthetic complex putative assembly protein PuhB [Pseudomonadota bacterium]